MPNYEVIHLDGSEVSESWHEVAQHLAGGKVLSGKAVEFELGEPVIGWLELDTGDYLVGVGEALRPFDLKYQGIDRDEADRIFEATASGLSQHYEPVGMVTVPAGALTTLLKVADRHHEMLSFGDDTEAVGEALNTLFEYVDADPEDDVDSDAATCDGSVGEANR